MSRRFVNKSLTNMPLEHLIATPLIAAGKAQELLANVTVDFIRNFGLKASGTDASGNELLEAVYVDFKYSKVTPETVDASGNEVPEKREEVNYTVPLLAIVWVPSLFIQTVDIDFEAVINSSSATDFQASVSGKSRWYSPVKIKASASLTNSSKKSYSATYRVQVRAEDKGYPDGLETVLKALTSGVGEK